ncbi:hypothetical protein M3B46_16930 [Sphingobacterium daejeonense]|uniref:hypothetical protein n=1 Tax=Sphingobacterium daejeonense TaxID=371142 RepID=UPI0021A3FA3F|nr:hypothetical protein [Sphingobacterium daejeonense]MCT1532692.1 hypothetical protein [Sphingobacterium daejeonense]
MKNLLYTTILSSLMLMLSNSCKKGEFIDSNQEFSTIIIKNLENKIKIDSIYVDNQAYKFDYLGNLIPYIKKDSMEVVIKYTENNNDILTNKIFNSKIENVKGLNELHLFYDDPKNLTISIGKHPLEGVEIKDGKVLAKIFNSSKLLSPNNEPIHLAFYDFIDLTIPFEPIYSNIPTDTIFNITNRIPNNFQEFRYLKDQIFWKAKVLKENKEELLIDNKKVYLFILMGETMQERVLILNIETQSLNSQIDRNNWYEILDGYTDNNILIYMSR